MRITKVKLDNYVCFYKTPEFELGPGINFIVGKNNSGKTALLDVLSHESKGEPHRSEATINRLYPGLSQQQTLYEIEYQFDRYELLKILFAEKDSFYIPQAPKDSRTAHLGPWSMPDGFLTDTTNNMRYRYESNIATHVRLGNSRPVHTVSGEQELRCYRAIAAGGRGRDSLHAGYHMPDRSTHVVNTRETSWAEVARRIPQSAYRFLAERRISAIADIEEGTLLKSDAANLSSVLSVLKASRLDTYLASVQRVIPEIQEILFNPGNGTVELQLSYCPSDKARDDLATSLDKCGTGVGQILAMLYVVLFYDNSQPRVVIIDEPNSFLHPGAVRKLLEIFEEHDHHQYIIATHSPTAIMSVQKKRILLVKRENMESTVQSVNVTDNTELEAALEAIGSKRSDIFGLDAVIWVEGKSDAQCFNLIWKHAHGELPQGVNILELVNTGDIEDKKHARIAVEIYRNLSGGVGLLPSVLGFVFDGDKNGAHEKMGGHYKKLIHYLPRQTFENYFLDFDGLTSLLSDLINNKGDEPPAQLTTSKSVQTWIDTNQSKSHFYPDGIEFEQATWTENINGAKFLSMMFKELAHPARKYKKVKDGEEIIERILADNPNYFQEIVDQITSIIEKDKQPESP